MADLTGLGAGGVELAARVSGEGPALVLVHGTTGSKASWALVEPLLAKHFTVWAYDRRGRGDSKDGETYDLDLEVDDVLAVLEAAGPHPILLGHSFGGYCAMEAALQFADLRSLILYEPAVHVARREDVFLRTRALLDDGELEAALELNLVAGAGVSPKEFAFYRSVPQVWDRFLDAAPTIAREAGGLLERSYDAARYSPLRAPTLLLVGELTDSPVYLSAEDLRRAVPGAEVEVLRGQRHLAFGTDPAGFADAVIRFAGR
jgi:pimeloyl-ACP methyl ester carboxylesterase